MHDLLGDPVELRGRSKQIFGNRYMLEVCAAMSSVRGRTNLTELIGESGISPSLYAGPLHRLLRAELIGVDERPGDGRRERWYRPTRTSLWRAARDLAS
jgi:hypothetical protein